MYTWKNILGVQVSLYFYPCWQLVDLFDQESEENTLPPGGQSYVLQSHQQTLSLHKGEGQIYTTWQKESRHVIINIQLYQHTDKKWFPETFKYTEWKDV